MPSVLSPGSEVVLSIEKPVAGGRMLARYGGQVVFVAGAIPGERVAARVERVSRQLAFAETIGVIEPSPDRRPGSVDRACGGSLYAHVDYQRQLALKSEIVADSFARIGKMQLPGAVPVMGSEEHGYRMRARLHARNGVFGFFREGTHDMCDAEATRQLLPGTIAALRELQSALKSAGIAGVTSCELLENAPASERSVLLEIEPSGRAPLHLDAVAGMTGVLFADHRSSRLTVAYGSPYVTDTVDQAGVSVSLIHHVQSFFQSNRYLLAQLVSRVLDRIPEGKVTDLYAGVGLFAVSLAARNFRGIVAVEGDRSSVRDLETNSAAWGAAIRVEDASVERYVTSRNLQQPDTLVLDPPRTGISAEAMPGILGLEAGHIAYVSCDPATLARDVKRLIDAGYALEHIEAFDLFPNTAHVETLVVLGK